MEPNEELKNELVTESDEINSEELDKVAGGGGSYGIKDDSGV
jgi:hypothetical protein